MNKQYMAIDLKSFYASVECRERKLDPLDTNLVVADESRTDKTICLAVSPALKDFGISSRPRLFEVKRAVSQLNYERQKLVLGHHLRCGSCSRRELINNLALEVDFRIARPRMKLYEQVSAYIYSIYLRYIAAEDIHVYSIDEALIDLTPYLRFYHCRPEELSDRIISDVYHETGITATVGIGTNLYLAKVAMDIMAKHMTPTKAGFKVATLNERTYREQLWDHHPITDFWRVGKGYARKLDRLNIHTMGEIAACSLGTLSDRYNKALLYRVFGIRAEILIDHAWGFENLTIRDINNYQPKNHCLTVGQLLSEPYSYSEGLMIIKEMSQELALKLLSIGQTTNELSLSIRYDCKTFNYVDDVEETEVDRFGRIRPRSVRGHISLQRYSNLEQELKGQLLRLFNDIVDSTYLLRRITITAHHLNDCQGQIVNYEQGNLFFNFSNQDGLAKQQALQETMLNIQKRFGKNAIFKGLDLKDKAMTLRRNRQIGGHLA